ncbi:Type IV inositol polyphosphate 5-phosphatase 11 [Ananas comosus]|uniref:Type IV inositol polyphosphate 5-phosphatase 11 n=1 Tax=Ananas comosus TaxID=4615 RepID=A0A199W9D7_ANACO|nr:Type IV inositol polyphosphate 5-phosphatase 11 [Ananas comosus]
MGNWCSSHPTSELQNKRLVSIDAEDATHEGIRTVGVQKICEFATSSALSVCIVTWNMNNKMPTENLSKLVSSDRKFDLLVVGLQEAPICNLAQVLQAAIADTHILMYLNVISCNLTCSLLGETTMQSIQLFLFEMEVDKESVGGCGGLIRRKKGAVAMWTSGTRSVGTYLTLSSLRITIGTWNHGLDGRSQLQITRNKHNVCQRFNPQKSSKFRSFKLLKVWSLLPFPRSSQMLTNKDQLLQEAKKGEVFNGYCEGTLSFKPTYKYNVGSSNYDTSYKIRVPSWTYRILFKVDHLGIDATLHSYESIDCIESSDHKPVKAHLCLKVNNG